MNRILEDRGIGEVVRVTESPEDYGFDKSTPPNIQELMMQRFFPKDWENLSGEERLRELNRALIESVLKLEKHSTTDGLTGLKNRKFFNKALQTETEEAQRHKHNLSMIFIDLDHFKNVNDTHGHQAGDEVLRKVADTLKLNIRKADLAARYGGEEMVILLPHASLEEAMKIAEKLRLEIENLTFETSNELKVTASFGVAQLEENEDIVAIADRNLYAAKANGRNCVVCESPEAAGEERIAA